MWTVRSLCTAILAACKLSSPCIERAAWAACAEGAVPPAAQATRPFPHKNKKGRKKENSSGRAAPQGSPALPARLCVGRR